MNQKQTKSKKIDLSFSLKRLDVMIFAFLISMLMLISVGTIMYKMSPVWSPFRLVEAESKNLGQAVKVSFVSNVPLKTRMEYGTSNIYLNSTKECEEYKTEHEVYVANVLPERTHYVKLIGYDANGKVYESTFFTVE